MNNIDLNDITLENIADWPPIVKAILMWVVIFLVLALGYFFSFKSQMEELEALKRSEKDLLMRMESKQQQAVNLHNYRKQFQRMKLEFGVLLQQLPAKAEIPELLEEISRTGIKDGLKFHLFDPMPEVSHDFYVEVPIAITIDGTYEQIAKFISDVASMKRIVTLHDFTIRVPEEKDIRKKPMRKINGRYPLIMNLTAKIYRYKAFSPDQAKGKKARRKLKSKSRRK